MLIMISSQQILILGLPLVDKVLPSPYESHNGVLLRKVSKQEKERASFSESLPCDDAPPSAQSSTSLLNASLRQRQVPKVFSVPLNPKSHLGIEQKLADIRLLEDDGTYSIDIDVD